MKYNSAPTGVRAVGVTVVGLLAATVAVLPASPALAIDPRGSMRAWGLNLSGQVGDGTTISRTTATPVSGVTGARDVDAGAAHNLAVASDGGVLAWGANNTGALGDGTTVNRTPPIRVPGLTGVIVVSAGGGHSLALTSSGTLWAWGLNNRGQVGDGTTVNRTRPVQVTGLPLPVRNISAGDSHTAVRLTDGSIWTWGLNGNGQLGDGTRVNRTRPVKAQFPGQSLSVDAGFDHTIALHADLTVFTWGDNSSGQLGDGTGVDRLVPGQVPGLTDVIQISAGVFHNVIRRATAPRTAFSWGDNGFGQLGDGTTIRRTRPVQIVGLVDPNSVVAGAYHSLGQELDGATPLRAWGFNSNGQLGDGTTINRSRPVVVPGAPGTVLEISGGAFHSVSRVVLS